MKQKIKSNKPLNKYLASILVLLSLTSCTTKKGPAFEIAKQDNEVFSSLLREPKKNTNSEETIFEAQGDSIEPLGLQILGAPQMSTEQAEIEAEQTIVPILSEELVSRAAFNNLTISSFINELYGNQLNLNFVLEPSLKNAADLVTLRITEPLSQKDTYILATESLKSYGVSTSLKNGVLYFSFTGDETSGEIPLLVSGRSLPEVPDGNRPILQIYPLQTIDSGTARTILLQMFPKNDLEIKGDPIRNALIFVGSHQMIQQALAATRLLDRPAMQEMKSRILKPTLNTVTELADNLESILKREGYSVQSNEGVAAIRLLPLESVGQLIVFSRSESALQHTIEWAKTLETEKRDTVANGLFSYQVQSTQALHIVQVLNNLGVANYSGLFSGSNGSENAQETVSDQVTPNSTSFNQPIVNENASGTFAVDEQLNTILYSGSGKSWLQVLPIIKRLDKPAPSVMVEVVLAEITLTDSENFGIDWLRQTTNGDTQISFGTSGAVGLGGSGFSFSLNSAGSTFATLNAFYQNEKANIRSRPRIMVKSGGEASIDIGNEIPIITSSARSVNDADAPLIDNISYRNTGVILEIKPTVHASGFVDIEISQELSEAADNSSSNIDSPIILNRRISTTVTLKDGGSVLLGGLISSTTSKGNQGVPVLGRLPILGSLFKTNSNSQNRTELMVMIIPYVINSPEEAEQLTDELQRARIDNLSSDIVPQVTFN